MSDATAADRPSSPSEERRVKILEITGVSIGGSAEHMLLLSKLLDRDRFDVSIALWRGGPLDDLIEQSGLPVTFLDKPTAGQGSTTSAKAFSGGRLRFMTGFVRLVRLMRREHFDVVHTHTSVAGMLGRLAAQIARVPIRVHMLHSIASNDHVEGVANHVFRFMERAADRATTHYIAGSDAITEKFAAKGLAEPAKITRIHYSLDIDRLTADSDCDLAETRSMLGATPDDVLVSLVGRLERQKGIEYLIDAAARVADRDEHIHFAIVGDGSLRNGLERRVAELDLQDRVTFTGWMTSIGAVMASSDVMAIPSRWEAFGIVNLEAMAASVPIVGFGVEGISEVVADQMTGYLFEMGDVDGLAAALLRLAADPELRLRLGTAGHQRLVDQFMPDRMVEQHAELFDLLSTRSREPVR